MNTLQSQQQRYTILSFLGRGGAGRVSLARDCSSGDILVAIKEGRQDSLQYEKQMLERIAYLEGIPRLLDVVVQEDDQLSLVIEYIEGQRMNKVERNSLSLFVIVQLISEFVAIMARLHSRGIVHYDLHDGNVLLGKDGHIHVIDLGCARLADPNLPGCFQCEVEDMIVLAQGWLMDLTRERSPEGRLLADWLEEARIKIERRREWTEESAITFLRRWQDFLAAQQLSAACA